MSTSLWPQIFHETNANPASFYERCLTPDAAAPSDPHCMLAVCVHPTFILTWRHPLYRYLTQMESNRGFKKAEIHKKASAKLKRRREQLLGVFFTSDI